MFAVLNHGLRSCCWAISRWAVVDGAFWRGRLHLLCARCAAVRSALTAEIFILKKCYFLILFAAGLLTWTPPKSTDFTSAKHSLCVFLVARCVFAEAQLLPQVGGSQRAAPATQQLSNPSAARIVKCVHFSAASLIFKEVPTQPWQLEPPRLEESEKPFFNFPLRATGPVQSVSYRMKAPLFKKSTSKWSVILEHRKTALFLALGGSIVTAACHQGAGFELPRPRSGRASIFISILQNIITLEGYSSVRFWTLT